MAKIKETIYVVTISELVKNDTDISNTVVSNDFVSSLEQIVQELIGSGAIVEATIA